MSLRVLFLFLAAICCASAASGKPHAQEHWNPKKNGLVVVVAFPEKNIPLPTDPTIWNKLARLFDFDGDDHWRVGHAGMLLVNKETGDVNYIDFGRYDDRIDLTEPRPLNYGTVRTPETVPELRLPVKALFSDGVLQNLDTLLINLAAKPIFENYGRIEAAVYDDLNLEKMKSYIAGLSDQGYIKYGCPTRQYCSRFARQVIRKGGGRYSLWIYTGQQMVRWNRKNL